MFSITLIISYAICQEAYTIKVNNRNLTFYDVKNSSSIRTLQRELNRDNYKISNIKFETGDIVVDVGGNIGGFAIPLALKFPFLKIYSFEPLKQTYENFKRNLIINNVSPGIITLQQKAVTGDSRNVTMEFNRNNSMLASLSGFHAGCTFCTGPNDKSQFKEEQEMVESVSLKDIFNHFHISKCKLLKIDCEGCEYEVLLNTPVEILKKVEVFRGEFHGHHRNNWNPRQLEKDMKDKFVDFQVEFGGQWLRSERRKKEKRIKKKKEGEP